MARYIAERGESVSRWNKLKLNWKSYLIAYSVTTLWILFVLPFYGLIILLAQIFSRIGDFFWSLDSRYRSVLKMVDKWLIKVTKLRGCDD